MRIDGVDVAVIGPLPLNSSRSEGHAQGLGDFVRCALGEGSRELVCVTIERSLRISEVERLVRPLAEDPAVMLASGVDVDSADPAGRQAEDRLTELVARALVAGHEPSLADLRQPLLGAFAARRSLLHTVSLPIGSGMRLSLLIDVVRRYGSTAVCEVALPRLRSDGRRLRALGPEAAELISAVHRRTPGLSAVSGDRLVQPWDDASRIMLGTAEHPPLERPACPGASRVPPSPAPVQA